VQGRSAINTGLVMLPLAFGLVIGSGHSHKVTLKLGRRTRTASVRYAVPPFVGSYLAVWALVGLPVYALYRPQGTAVAGTLTIVAGYYELTPLKRHCRRRCRESVRSGVRFGLSWVGSSIGLMAMLVAVGVMSVAWMAVAAVLILGQKLLPPRGSTDVPLGLAIVALGVLVLLAPSAVPGLTQAM
jgi:predicted metal-binding membrane protein